MASKLWTVVDTETFLQLTDAQFLPESERGAALQLLRLEAGINDGGSTNKFSKDAQPSSLQERCFSAFSAQWDVVDWNLVEKELAEHAPQILLSVYKHCLGDAQLKRKAAHDRISQQATKLQENCTFPDQIFVSGAGVPEANGTYHLSNAERNGGPVFRMQNEWNGNEPGSPFTSQRFATQSRINCIGGLQSGQPVARRRTFIYCAATRLRICFESPDGRKHYAELYLPQSRIRIWRGRAG